MKLRLCRWVTCIVVPRRDRPFCEVCWSLLPREHKRAICRTRRSVPFDRGAHSAAILAAMQYSREESWREHP